MSAVRQLSTQLGTPERTLRRAVAVGSIRARRLGQRRLRLDPGETDYLRLHWALLAELRAALRTEPNVRLAILAGSMARGDDHGQSDVDLIVELERDGMAERAKLALRLKEKFGRDVDVASLRSVLDDPLSLLQVLDEGRVIVDRGEFWGELRAQRVVVRKRAMRAFRRQQRRVRTTRAGALL